MAIEAQLNRRQADLGSLKQQQAWLQSQTSMSTITVNLQLTPEKKATTKDKDESGFLAGLSGLARAQARHLRCRDRARRAPPLRRRDPGPGPPGLVRHPAPYRPAPDRPGHGPDHRADPHRGLTADPVAARVPWQE